MVIMLKMMIMLKITIKAMMMEVTIAEMTNYKEKEYFGRFMPGGVYLKIEKRYKKFCFGGAKCFMAV